VIRLDIAGLYLTISPVLMVYFVHIQDEMGRNPVNRSNKGSKELRDLFRCQVNSSLFYGDHMTALHANFSPKHMKLRRFVEGKVKDLLDVIPYLGEC
jgi:hypothetical protein